jgi:hypothetical protein
MTRRRSGRRGGVLDYGGVFWIANLGQGIGFWDFAQNDRDFAQDGKGMFRRTNATDEQ